MKRLFYLLLLCIAVLPACKKKDNAAVLNSFIGLTAEKDTILTGQSTKITALVDGENVTFSWSSMAGDILGSGSEVTYVAPTCTPGVNPVNCTVSAADNSETKTIFITVF